MTANNWQTIDSAPKTGEHILGLPQNRKNSVIEVYWNHHKHIWQNDYTDGEWVITHWMPLPELPKE